MPSPYDNLRFSQSQHIPQYHGAPIEEFGDLLSKREADYRQNIADFDQIELAASNLDVNDADYSLKKEALNNVRNSIQQIADTGGAYEFAGTQVRQLAKDFTGNQALKAAMENEATIKGKKDEFQKLYLNGKMSEVGYREAMNQLASYGGVGEGKDGIYDRPSIYQPVKYTDIGKKLDDFGRGFKANMIDTGWTSTPDGQWMEKATKRVLTADEVERAMRDYAEGSPDIMATANEHQTITGEDILTPLITAEGMKLGFSESQFDRKADPYSVASYKSGLDNAIAGVPVPLIATVDGYEIKSNEAYAVSKGALQKEKAQVANEMSAIVARNEPGSEKDINRLKYQYEALDQKEQGLEFIKEELTKQAFRNLERPYDPSYLPEQETIDKAKLTAAQEFQSTNLGVMTKGRAEEEAYVAENYQKHLNKIDPIAAEVEKLWEEAGESKAVLTHGTSPKTKKERDSMDAYAKALTGTIKNKKTLGEEGADALAVGLKWYSGEQGGQNVGDDALENLEELLYNSIVVDPNTGTSKFIFNFVTSKGDRGMVSLGSDAINDYVQRTGNGKMYSYLAGPQLSNIDKVGVGDIQVDANTKIKVKSFMHVPNEGDKDLYEIENVPYLDTNTNQIKYKAVSMPDRESAEIFITNLILQASK